MMFGKINLRPFARMAMVMSVCLLVPSCTDEMLDTSNPIGLAGIESDSICFGVSSPDAATKASSDVEPGRVLETESFVLRSKESSDTLCVTATITEGINLSSYENMPLTRAAQVTSLETYGGFHVQAHIAGEGEGGIPDGSFFMNDDVTNQNGGIWSTDVMYYWPGEGYQLKFYAWAPADAFSSVPTTPESTELVYTVPESVSEQRDLLVAVSEDDIQGNHNQAVALDFRHILTAVKFEVGSQMQPGTIKSVALKGVIGGGTYDMASGKWELDAPGAVFTQTLSKLMSGSETNGSEITTADGFFMMVPQTLPENAYVEVVFNDGISSEDRTLTANIGESDWPQGMTVTYKLSISPEYELEFTSEPELQDAHYVIYPIHIKAQDVPGGSWTITSTDPDNVTLRTDLTILTRRGFWIDEDKGDAIITSTTSGEDIIVYAFLTENAGEDTRNVQLELRPSNKPDAAPATFTISQLCPSWNGDLGCERIEDGDYPWGFLWPKGMTITYNMENAGLGDLIRNALLNAFLSWFTDYNQFITKETFLLSITSVTINYDAVPQVNVARDFNNGWKNTLELYNYNGLSDVSTLISVLEDWGGTTDDVLPLNPDYYAARACAMKNRYHKTIEENMGQTIEIPILEEEDLVWYLPSRNESLMMNDARMSGNYWTSTVYDDEYDNENAYKYTVGGNTSLEKRNSYLHVRAVRQKP